jgi:GNAT superfamily N-acetyltransferase
MADKKKTLKTYKTAAGAQQYGDSDAWRKLSRKITKDFVNLSTSDFKKKYGADAYQMYDKVHAGESASVAKKYKEEGFGKRLVKQLEGYEKEWQDSSKKKGPTKMARGGYANCGASMKATQSSTMMCGGMASKKKK